MKSSLFINLMSGFSFSIVNIITSFLVVPLYLYYINSEELGIWFLVNATISSFGIIGLLGGNQFMVKKLSYSRYLNHKNYANYYISTAFYMLLLSSIIFSIGASIVLFNVDFFFNKTIFDTISKNDFVHLLLIVSLTYVFIYPMSIFNDILRAGKYLILSSLLANLKVFIFTILSIFMLIIYKNIESFGYAYLISNFFVDLYAYSYVKKHFPHIVIKFNYFRINIVKKSLKYTKNIFLLLVSTSGKNMYLPYLIANYLGPLYVTIFTVSNKLSVSLSGLITKVYYNLFPYLAELSESNSNDTFKIYYINTLFITLRISIIFSILFVFFNETFVSLWVGQEYYIGWDINLLLSLSFLFSLLKPATTVFFNSTGEFEKLPYIAIFELVLGVIFSVFLHKYYGFLGLIMGYSFSSILYILYGHIVIIQKYKIKISRYSKTIFMYIIVPSSIAFISSYFIEVIKLSIIQTLCSILCIILLSCIIEIYMFIINKEKALQDIVVPLREERRCKQ